MEQKVGAYFWIRVVVMICTLVAVLSIMYKLKQPGAITGAADANHQSINICPTRVSSVSVIGRFALKQEGISWYKMGEGERVELDPDAVEKWFGQHCTVDAQPLEAVAAASPLVTFAYVTGDPKTLLMNAEGQFTLDGLNFRSIQLANALSALENLPVRMKPGQK